MTSRALARWITSNNGATLFDGLRALARRHGRSSAWLVAVTWAGCLAAFAADLVSNNTLAFGVFYMPLVATAFFHRSRHAVWVLTVIAVLMVVVGSFLPSIPNRIWDLVENRGLSVCAILITAAFVARARSMQDLLAQRTAQAEMSERIRSEVLTNLSEEIRAPLHGMIGVLELAATQGDPGHRAALSSVRGSGRRLASMVDNLVDLTQLDTITLPPEPFDLGALTRQTVEGRRRDAVERQIALTFRLDGGRPDAGPTIVNINQWAVRRILENKVSDALAYTSPGGRISIDIVPGNENHQVVITTSEASWPPGVFQPDDDRSGMPLAPSAMGLVLSQRLSRAIGASLTFATASDRGSTVRLAVPVSVTRPADQASR
jgi:two-component system sensor histidine kinase EvgS